MPHEIVYSKINGYLHFSVVFKQTETSMLMLIQCQPRQWKDWQ